MLGLSYNMLLLVHPFLLGVAGLVSGSCRILHTTACWLFDRRNAFAKSGPQRSQVVQT